MTDVVIDASAVLAAIRNEPRDQTGMQDVRRLRTSALNYCEIVGWLAERGATAEDIEKVIAPFELVVSAFDQKRAVSAGLLAARTKRRGISLADRACLALAVELGLPVVTGDRAWCDLGLDVEIRLIR